MKHIKKALGIVAILGLGISAVIASGPKSTNPCMIKKGQAQEVVTESVCEYY